jgi:hypothetical protein
MSAMPAARALQSNRLAIIVIKVSSLAEHSNQKKISCANCAAVNPNNFPRETTRLSRLSPKRSLKTKPTDSHARASFGIAVKGP